MFPGIDEPIISGYEVGHECHDSSILYEMSRKDGILEH
jgi:hypothetical protein